MKKYIAYLLLVFLGTTFISCDDPIDVELTEAPPRLVIEASLDWEKGTAGNNQTVKLSTSTPFFDNNSDTSVLGASVKVTNNDTNAEFIFTDQNDGTYTTNSFVPLLNNSYTLEVVYNGEVYNATETLMPITGINEVFQSFEGGFDEDLLDVNITYDDPQELGNYYMIRLQEVGDLFPIIETRSDEFTNGNVQDEFFEKDEDDDNPDNQFDPGDSVNIKLFGISERYYNFITLLIEQYDSAGNPFATTPAEIRGNCINVTNEDNYAFGYFRVTEFDQVDYTFQ
ncbi:uncharacterized protein DUF4249 [Kordia periserrulae]|uniref:Uncharacterized protein DUF4249 n=1 Tax=Kordia periserrulae TaxID=701523 RepID=A0A2T6BWL9_9FLAO|nr:DUF4249 domain-containing protein [Kordia periserrulae]PTX60470.1 uncharacterized protein DUF4249 [Kordia periserrulae]